MRDELFILQQLFGGGNGQGWLAAAYLLGLIAVLAYRPERIRLPGLFRWACVLFALSVMVPGVLRGLFFFLQGISSSAFRSSRGPGDFWTYLYPVLNASGPVLLGVSLICALVAVSPGPRYPGPPQPPRHPLG